MCRRGVCRWPRLPSRGAGGGSRCALPEALCGMRRRSLAFLPGLPAEPHPAHPAAVRPMRPARRASAASLPGVSTGRHLGGEGPLPVSRSRSSGRPPPEVLGVACRGRGAGGRDGECERVRCRRRDVGAAVAGTSGRARLRSGACACRRGWGQAGSSGPVAPHAGRESGEGSGAAKWGGTPVGGEGRVPRGLRAGSGAPAARRRRADHGRHRGRVRHRPPAGGGPRGGTPHGDEGRIRSFAGPLL